MTGDIDVQHVSGATVHGVEGATIGTAQHVYLNDGTGAPQWISVLLGETAEPQRFAPLHGARMQARVVTLAVPADAVRGAPEIADGAHLEPADEDHLYGYYQQWLDDSQPSAPENDVATMTRSEEQLQVGTVQRQSGTARIHKRVVTENVTQTVPVSHEELQTLREPITGAAPLPAGVIEEADYEIVLSAERLVVSKEIVPVERIRIRKHVVIEEQQINETLRREQIDDVDVRTDDPDR